MKQADGNSKLPVPITPPRLLNQGLVWFRSRGSSLKTHRFSGISSVLMAPVFFLEFLFLALIIGIILLIVALYMMFNLLLSLPRLKKGT
jgi:hypothetical protein